MGGANDQCEIYKLPSAVIESELDKILEQHGFKNSSIKVTAGSVKGDNYMGLLYRISAVRDGKKFCLVCKSEPTSEVRREELRTGIVFDKETFVYNTIFPEFEKFQEQKGIPKNLRFNNHPKCLGTGKGFLFLNDLREEGYDMYDRLKDLDFVHVKLAVEALGRLHAVGFALKHQRPEVFETYKDLRDLYFGEPVNEGLYNYFRVMFDHATDALDVKEEELREKMHNLKNNLHKKLPKLLASDDAEPYAVITHGDCWNNNIMYKYENGKPVTACLLDYQMCRYASPALDLAYYIFCCTDQKFRDRYYTEILQAYHRSLSSLLVNLGSNPFSVFPYEALEDHMRRFGAYGLAMATVIVKTIRSQGDDIPDMDEVAEKIRADKDYAKLITVGSEESMRAYKFRMADVIRDIERLGMI